jgi:beta-lactam-binding protein with PASTA domain
VLGSDPKTGLKVKPGTAVDVFVSKGPKPIDVPNFIGKDGDHAESKLADLKLDVNRADAYSDTVAEGLVISQSPSSGQLFKGDKVDLVVSLGPELIAVPDVVQSRYEDAKQTLEDAGFVVEVVGDLEHALGFVYRTDPAAGTELRRGSTVLVYVI